MSCCVGYVDGTEIPLEYKPGIDHVSYFSKERIYSMKMQGVCDFSLLIRQITVGYPGSVHDARIYNSTRLSTHPTEYFTNEEFLAADKA